MTHEEAMRHVARLGTAVQKVRSNMAESELSDVSETLTPWFYGDRNVLRAVAIVQERGSVTPGEFYNLMWIAHRPENAPLIGMLFAVNGEPDLPEPDPAWLMGWQR